MTGPAKHHRAIEQLPYVIFRIQDELYAVSSQFVREIVMLPDVSALPNQAPEMRGVINLRGKVLPLLDLRTKLGLPSAASELETVIQLLQDRENDHRNWLGELEACVRDHREFKLARDPHACKFGIWYDHFETNNNLLKMVLKKMDEPHQRIHATAGEVLHLTEQGAIDQANELLLTRRNGDLALLCGLFEEARRTLRENHRELAVVLHCENTRFAVTIDQVETVERIPEEGIEPLPVFLANTAQKQWRIGKRLRTNQTVVILDAAGISTHTMESSSPPKASA